VLRDAIISAGGVGAVATTLHCEAAGPTLPARGCLAMYALANNSKAGLEQAEEVEATTALVAAIALMGGEAIQSELVLHGACCGLGVLVQFTNASERMLTELLNCGGVACTCKMLQKHARLPPIAGFGLLVLLKAALRVRSDLKRKTMVIQAGAAEACVAAMTMQPEIAQIQSDGSAVLRELCRSCGEEDTSQLALRVAIHAGGVKAVCVAVENHSGTSLVRGSACTALSVMVTHQAACVAAIQANVAKSITEGMIADPTTRGANVDACVLIQALLLRHGRSKEVLREAAASLIAAGAPHAVSGVLWAHPHDPELCHHVAAALEALMAGLPEKAKPDKSSDQSVVTVDEPVAALISVLHAHGKEEVTARKVLSALWAISLKGEAAMSALEAMSRAGAANAIREVMVTHFSDAAIAEQGCGLFWLLANHSDDDKLALSHQRALRSVVWAMRHHDSNEHVQIQAIGVLTVLALSGPRTKLMIGYEDGLAALCHALGGFHPRTGVPAAACAALGTLCTLRRFRVGVSRVAFPLVQTLHDRFGCENPHDDQAGDGLSPEQYGPELHTQTLTLLHQLTKVNSSEKRAWSRETHKYLARELRCKIYTVLVCMFGTSSVGADKGRGELAGLAELRDLHGAIAAQIEAQFHGVA